MDEQKGGFVILCADDDLEFNYLLSWDVKDHRNDIDLYFVENGVDLYNYLTHKGKYSDLAFSPAPDLILVDLVLPALDFNAFQVFIKNDPGLRDVPVVVMTSTAVGLDINEVFPYQVSGFIEKPVKLRDLRRLLNAIGKDKGFPEIREKPGD